MTLDCNCKKCKYRIVLATAFDIHIWKEDCDKYGTEYCLKQSNPRKENNDAQ